MSTVIKFDILGDLRFMKIQCRFNLICFCLKCIKPVL